MTVPLLDHRRRRHFWMATGNSTPETTTGAFTQETSRGFTRETVTGASTCETATGQDNRKGIS